MRRTLLVVVAALMLVCVVYGQQSKPDAFAPMHFLIGDWAAEGGGQPGQGSGGGTTFSLNLQNHIVVRKNFSEYAATKDRPAFRHDDLMVIFEEAGALKANYWDNEGHVIRYGVASPTAGKVVFLSEASAGPRFRLTYLKISDEEHIVLFEIATPGTENFQKYVEGRAKRK